jgi:hypothetical protein
LAAGEVSHDPSYYIIDRRMKEEAFYG